MNYSTHTQIADMSRADAEELEVVLSTEEEIARLRDELDAEREQLLRLAAEYKNFRRRTELEKAAAADDGKHQLLVRLLSLGDDLELALKASDGPVGSVKEGVDLIRRRFHEILQTNDVSPFDSEGERFDPERHEAFAMVDSGEDGSGVVQEEMRRGYFYKDKLLRPALVVVGR